MGVGFLLIAAVLAVLADKPLIEAYLLQGKFGQFGGPRDELDWGMYIILGYAMVVGTVFGFTTRLIIAVIRDTKSHLAND
jgi:hypothetical protein